MVGCGWVCRSVGVGKDQFKHTPTPTYRLHKMEDRIEKKERERVGEKK